MTHTLAMEWAQHGIRVNSVSPGLVNTAMTYWVPQQPDWEQQLKYYGGFPRLAEVQELGGAYVYLLSDAASYTTSIDIPVNGVIGSKFLTGVDLIRDADLYSLLIGVPLCESCVGSNPSLYAEDRNKREDHDFLAQMSSLVLIEASWVFCRFCSDLCSGVRSRRRFRFKLEM